MIVFIPACSHVNTIKFRLPRENIMEWPTIFEYTGLYYFNMD